MQTRENRIPNVEECCVGQDCENLSLLFVIIIAAFIFSVAGFDRVVFVVVTDSVLCPLH